MQKKLKDKVKTFSKTRCTRAVLVIGVVRKQGRINPLWGLDIFFLPGPLLHIFFRIHNNHITLLFISLLYTVVQQKSILSYLQIQNRPFDRALDICLICLCDDPALLGSFPM